MERENLNQELMRVSGERDMLAAQLQHDSQMWTDKITSLRSQCECWLIPVLNKCRLCVHTFFFVCVLLFFGGVVGYIYFPSLSSFLFCCFF